MMKTRIQKNVDFSYIRYAQCWEDADILLEALDIQHHHTCLSIISGGENTLAMLTKSPKKVIAIDLNPAQIYCLELKVAAIKILSYPEFLEFIGINISHDREKIYQRCCENLSPEARTFWDNHSAKIKTGIIASGKFEHYLEIFRNFILPLSHSKQEIQALIQHNDEILRRKFYQEIWDNWRWRLTFRIFFSRFFLGKLGRDPEFFRYVEDNVAKKLLERTQYALTNMAPYDNPYLQWILFGKFLNALPFALRPENYNLIKQNLSRLEWHCVSMEEFAQEHAGMIDRFNLSDIFEYISLEDFKKLLITIEKLAGPDARLAYWNLFVQRLAAKTMPEKYQALTDLTYNLSKKDKNFFYNGFFVDNIIAKDGYLKP